MRKTGPPSEAVACADIATTLGEARLALVYMGEENEHFKTFQESAGHPSVADNFKFLHTDAACAAEYGATADAAVLFRNFDESPVVAPAEWQADKLVDFMQANSTPRFITFSEDYIEPIFGHRRAAIILFTEETDSVPQQAFKEASENMQGEILFVQSGVSDGIQSRLAEFIGVTKADLPTVRIIDPANEMRKFKYDGDLSSITFDQVKTYVHDFKAGNLRSFLKSEPIPATQDEAVHVVVGDSFNDVVKDPTKDVLVKFYAPWCGHCKKLAPVWDELAEHTKDIDDLIIAKFDATVNEAEGVDIRGYPTLIWYPKDNKKGVNYEGDREVEGFKNFLHENSASYKASGKHNPEKHTEL